MADSSPPPILSLYYIDTRPLTASDGPLPLLETLRPEDRTSITRFHRLADRHMSLASTILKYVFVHRTAKVPWSDVVISRTPRPHLRPFWNPATASRPPPGTPGAVEFNVSHQAGLVALAGCESSSPPSTVVTSPDDGSIIHGGPSSPPPPPPPRWSSFPDPDPAPDPAPTPNPLRLGIDITCVSEPSRSPDHITTASQFCDWVDIFAEVFSSAEVADMKSHHPPSWPPHPSSDSPSSPMSPSTSSYNEGGGELIAAKLRRFYTFWALKEAYIKMTGEALLAPWLRDLEFRNVRAPDVAEEGRWGNVEGGVEVWFRRERVEGARVEVVGFGRDFVVALAARGLNVPGPLLGSAIKEVDMGGDVRACAEGSCDCLSNQTHMKS